MIRTLALNYAPILACSKYDSKTAAGTASYEMVMGAVQALCVFSLLVSQQNHLHLSLKALHDGLKWFYKKKGIVREQKILKSAKAKVEKDLLAVESHQLLE